MRVTPNAYKRLQSKNNDTLYFVIESDSSTGSLYLGNKLISESLTNFSELKDVLISENLQDGHILAYNAEKQSWENVSIYEAIGFMSGASSEQQGGAGLVPAPGIGQNDLFLRGDGTWALPSTNSDEIAKLESQIADVNSSVNNITDLLNKKANISTVQSLAFSLDTVSQRVDDIEKFLNSEYFSAIEELQNDMATVMAAVTWGDL